MVRTVLIVLTMKGSIFNGKFIMKNSVIAKILSFGLFNKVIICELQCDSLVLHLSYGSSENALLQALFLILSLDRFLLYKNKKKTFSNYLS